MANRNARRSGTRRLLNTLLPHGTQSAKKSGASSSSRRTEGTEDQATRVSALTCLKLGSRNDSIETSRGYPNDLICSVIVQCRAVQCSGRVNSSARVDDAV